MSLSSRFAANMSIKGASKASTASNQASAASASPRPSTTISRSPQKMPSSSARSSSATAAVARPSDDWPLIVSGRTAMLGFAFAASAELLSAHPQPALSDFSSLAASHPLGACALLTAVAAGSAAPVLRGEPHDSEAFGPFNARAEMANSAVALVGLCGLIATEALKGSALL